MMLVVALCLMMQLVQFSAAIWPPTPKPVPMAARKSRKFRSKRRGTAMSAEQTGPSVAHTDFNSNTANGAEFMQSATASEIDFVHDNSEYQWFLDYGRDGASTQHTSVLSSCLGDSLGGRYEALARRLDANLAHVDMETFRSEDIHSLLAALPALTGSGSDLQSDRPAGEMYASVTGSLMTKFDLDSSSSPHTSSQDSAESAMSICKSEPLFSPVKECAPLPVASNFSVDSLDCELLLTCRHANKDNYTIAFEAESDAEHEVDSISGAWTDSPQYGVSMARSDSVYTTWSKLSGNNNHSSAAAAAAVTAEASLRSHSLPDLAHPRTSTSSSTGSEQRLSLVKLFMRRNEDDDDDDDDDDSSVIPLTESVSSLNINNNHNTGQSQGTQTHSATKESATQHSNDQACRSVQTSIIEEKVRPVYVCYPNYALPNLDFLQSEKEVNLDKGEILLAPQRFRPATAPAAPVKKPRPFSCNDVEALRRKGGFAHVRDWPSLTFLLPREYQQVLTEIPETPRPLFTVSKSSKGCHCTSLGSSSSGYRGSSDMLLTESHQTPPPPPPPPQDPLMFVYRYDSASSDGSTFSTVRAAPPAPPPRGILRKDSNNLKRQSDKRQLGQHIPLSTLMGEMTSEELDEGVDAGTDSSFDEGGTLTNTSAPRPPTPPIPRPSSSTDSLGTCFDALVPEASALLASLISSKDETESWDDQHMARLRAQVSRFLSGGGHLSPINPLPNISITTTATTNSSPGSSCDCSRSHNKKSVKFSEHVCVHLRCGGGQNGTDETIVLTPPNSPSSQMPPLIQTTAPTVNLAELEQKRALVTAVCDSIDRLVTFYAAEPDFETGDLEVARLALSSLCPALYSALSDGLRPEIATAFGPVPNSLWQVVEASSQAGSPLTRSLSELTLRINGEPALSDAPLKFNAFVFGLLNAGSFHAWLGYLRARESVLRKHYTSDALMTSPATRSLLDRLVVSLRPLAGLPFNLDLLHECRELHASLRRIDSAWSKERPRSCVAANVTPSMTTVSSSLGGSLADLASTVKKRWSGIHLGSKLFQAFDRLAAEDSDEEYTDSLENPRRGRGGKGINTNNPSTPPAPNSSDTEESEPTLNSQRGPDVTGRFRRLQRKWELLSGISNEDKTPSPTSTNSSLSTTIRGSKIPRPVAPVGSAQAKRTPRPLNRPETTHTTAKRPSSLPYRAAPTSAGPRRTTSNHSISTPRRAASSSLGRRGNTDPPKFVRTVCHRLPSDNGHLSFNEGEKLRLVLEVDAKWLLCCRGDSKGLVPRSAVVALGDSHSLERRPTGSPCA